MNTQQRQQERIRLWELDREATREHCEQVNRITKYGIGCTGTIGIVGTYELPIRKSRRTNQRHRARKL